MNVVPHVQRGADCRNFTFEPRLDEIIAETWLFKWSKGIRNHELAERKPHRLAQVTVELPCQSFGQPVGRKSAQWRFPCTLALLENCAGDYDAAEPARRHRLYDVEQI